MGREPPALQARPKLNGTEQFYWELYQELSAGRSNNGFGPCPLTMRDILDTADLYELRSAETRRDCVRFMRAMDRTFFEQVAKKHG